MGCSGLQVSFQAIALQKMQRIHLQQKRQHFWATSASDFHVLYNSHPCSGRLFEAGCEKCDQGQCFQANAFRIGCDS